MSQMTVRQILKSQAVDGAALSNTTTPTSIIHPTARHKFLMNEQLYPNAKLVVRVHGRITHPVSPTNTLLLECRLGPTSNIAIASSGTITLNASAKTDVSWKMEWWLTCRALGSGTAANFMHQAFFESEAVVGAASGTTLGRACPASAPVVGTGFDSTVDNIFDFFATWSGAAATYSIQTHGYEVELGN
jgi:hypothetical protein